jgi:3-methyladenine DNA glycosylase AlkD
MELDDVMKALEAAGTAQNRKVYPRHGVTAPLFGVSYAELGKLHKRIKVDHDLAVQLWATQNHDARVLAMKIADPALVSAKQADQWMRDVDNYIVSEALAGVVAAAPCGPGRAVAWRDRKGEWPAATGWAVTANLVGRDGVLTDRDCRTLLTQIEQEIHTRPNRVRHAMNLTLITIGARPSMRTAALRSAGRVGSVDVDHGQTGCVTPAAAPYIEKIAAHEARRSAAKAAR